MKILVVGSGGREHAICWALQAGARRHDIHLYCAPGNGGIAELADCVALQPTDVAGLVRFAVERRIDLTIVGGEASLAAGLTDAFESSGLRVMGPSLSAARLEVSKIFAKTFMAKHSIPTPRWRAASDAGEALGILRSGEFGAETAPIVIKVDGLAAGKGVVVAKNRREAEAAVGELSAGNFSQQFVIEEALEGCEVSLLLFADGRDYALMPPARDHKRVGDHDAGLNTGGMGAITSAEVIGEDHLEYVVRRIIEPSLGGAIADGFPFRGVLFVGLMLTEDGPQVLEYNVRFGDPEAQAILTRLKSDFVDVCEAVADRRLGGTNIVWANGASACVVLAAPGYPVNPRTGGQIQGLDRACRRAGVQIFHAGTTRSADGQWLTAGGRVLGVASAAATLDEALGRCYLTAEDIHWDGIHYRRDIGKFSAGRST
ncbi:MAG: phosphoribosylamine--glycine ligase [Pyrinomonadaceae bacterium]